MTPASLTPALFTAPAAQGQPAASGASTGQPGGKRFSSLLDGSTTAPATDAVPADAMASAMTAEPLTDDEDVADAGLDAPWPPLGLETLLVVASPAASPPPASLDPAIAGAVADPGTTAASVLAALSASGSATAGQPDGSTRPAALAVSAPVVATAALAARPGAGPVDANTLAVADPGNSDGAIAQALSAGKVDSLQAPAIASVDSTGLVAMAALNASAGASPLPAQDVQASVVPTQADMGGEHFDAEVAEGVQYMVEHKLQSARIRISPQQLGMIEVELRLDGDRVHANFSSAHADVRQALHDSLPRLRDLLDANGLQMGQAAVGDGAVGQDRAQQPAPSMAGGIAAAGDGEPTPAAPSAMVWRHNRLLDTYA